MKGVLVTPDPAMALVWPVEGAVAVAGWEDACVLLAWYALAVGPGHAGVDVGGACGLGSPDDVPPIDDRISKPLVAPRLKPLRCVLAYGVCSVGPLGPCMCVDASGALLSLASLDMLPA